MQAPSLSTTRLAIYAGEGELPLKVVENAQQKGFTPMVYAMDKRNMPALKAWVGASNVQYIQPGLLGKNIALAHHDQITQAVFAGKVNKWILFRSPRLDQRGMRFLKSQTRWNDDALMLALMREFEQEGITVLNQTDFLQTLFIGPGTYTHRKPSEAEWHDITYAMAMAKDIARLDIGQTVAVANGMVLAVESIEGTDQTIQRAGKWGDKKGGVVAKVEKPNQDLRFDVPTVGLRTLKAMKKAGLTILAIEAHKTLVVDFERVCRLANQWHMSLVAV